jgi:peroxiredoxin
MGRRTMNHKKKITGVVGLFLLLAATAGAVGVGEPIPEFELKTLEGKTVSSAEVKDKSPMVLMFWATWCPYCVKEIPRFKKLFSEYGAKGMVFLAVNPGINDSVAKVERFVKENKIEYPVAMDNGAAVTKKLQVRGAPTIIVIDKRGIVRYRGATVPADLGEHFAALEK